LQQKSDELSKENDELKETINERNKFIITEAATIESLKNWIGEYTFKPEEEKKKEFFLRKHKELLSKINDQDLKEKVKRDLNTTKAERKNQNKYNSSSRGRNSGMSL
jgi:hypothetical protein